MKRFLTLATTLALVAIFAMPAQAQEDAARFGLQGGMSLSSFTGDDVPDDQSSKVGFLAGSTFAYFFSQNWGLGLEANWLSALGAKAGSGTEESEIKLSYFSFPLTLHFVFPLGESEKTWLGLQAGISANINLSCDEGPSGSVNFDCKDDTESFQWAVPLGAGIGFKSSDETVVYLRARYQLGLNDTFNDGRLAKLNWWEFILGFSYVP